MQETLEPAPLPQLKHDTVPHWDSSGDNVGRDSVGELFDFVAQMEFALLHPGKLELVAIAGFAHRINIGIESAMFDFEHRQHFFRIVVVHFFVLAELRFAVIPRRVSASLRRLAGEAMRNDGDKAAISCFIRSTVTVQPVKGN